MPHYLESPELSPQQDYSLNAAPEYTIMLPEDLQPIPGDPYNRDWIGKYMTEDPRRHNCYDPKQSVDYSTVVENLWEDVCNYEVDRQIWTEDNELLPGKVMESNTEDFSHCVRFDHVDFYRIIYITVVYGKTVSDITDIDIDRITAVLDMVDRPIGYEPTLDIRGAASGRKWNFTPEEIQRLFDILNNKKYHGRDLAFQRVLQWVVDGAASNTILRGLPEAMLSLQGRLEPLNWEATPFSFMYELDVEGWYQENAVTLRS